MMRETQRERERERERERVRETERERERPVSLIYFVICMVWLGGSQCRTGEGESQGICMREGIEPITSWQITQHSSTIKPKAAPKTAL